MDYEQRLKVAVKIILSKDSKSVNLTEDFSDSGVTATLKPYQVEGVLWLIRQHFLGVNVILGDEIISLCCTKGSTVSSLHLSCLQYMMELYSTLGGTSFKDLNNEIQLLSGNLFLYLTDGAGKDSASYLVLKLFKVVLCPLSVTDGWVSEIGKYTPKLNVLQYVGNKAHRCHLRRNIYDYASKQLSLNVSLPFDVFLTTYDIALMDQDFLSQIPWQYTIVDEAQRLKNPSSVLYKVLKDRFLMPRCLLMTGTPIQNNLTELWALLHFCMPSIFGTMDQFLFTFSEAGDDSDHDKAKTNDQLKTLKYILSAFMLRRTKAKLIECGNLVLPPLTEITVMAPLSVLQKKVYLSILRRELSKLLALSSGSSNHQSLQNIVIQLRKACSHPYLFPGVEPEPYEEGEHLIQASGKLMILDQLLQRLQESGHRVLLFAQMTHTLDILQDFLELRNYSYERLDGSIRAEERFAAIRSFGVKTAEATTSSKTSTHDAFVFMISTRAGGVGLNLVAADTVIFYEQDWNPQVDKQALQRAHRIGQTNHVLSINIVTACTIEEVIMRRANLKLQLSHKVIGDHCTDKESKEMDGVDDGDLRSIIFGLHKFDPTEIRSGKHGEVSMSELKVFAQEVIALRHRKISARGDGKYELDAADLLRASDYVVGGSSTSVTFDPGLDEASYLSWVEKFKEASQINGDQIMELGSRRNLPEDKRVKLEAAKKKAEEKKLSKWEALGYHTLSVKDPVVPVDPILLSDSGSVRFVYGDCTHPSKVETFEPIIIYSCVDDSGNWGHGGMFDALEKLSESIPIAYQRAAEFRDLQLGDLHLIKLNGDNDEQNMHRHASRWVALAIVQSYNPRRKVPRSAISLPDLEISLAKASFSAAQHSASIHMPRIGYQDGSDRSQWYTVERLLRKYASIYGINIFVYYFKRSS